MNIDLFDVTVTGSGTIYYTLDGSDPRQIGGAAVGNEIGSMYKQMDRPQNVGHFFCLFDPAAFLPSGEMTDRTDAMIDRVKACRNEFLKKQF